MSSFAALKNFIPSTSLTSLPNLTNLLCKLFSVALNNFVSLAIGATQFLAAFCSSLFIASKSLSPAIFCNLLNSGCDIPNSLAFFPSTTPIIFCICALFALGNKVLIALNAFTVSGPNVAPAAVAIPTLLASIVPVVARLFIIVSNPTVTPDKTDTPFNVAVAALPHGVM